MMKQYSRARLFERILGLLMVAVLLFGHTMSAAAEGLTGDQLQSVRYDTTWYDPTKPVLVCSSNGASIPNGTTAQNGQAIFDFLTEAGRLKPYQAAGVIGNMMVESTLMPQRLQGTPPTTITTAETYMNRNLTSGWGLVQWTPGSKFINNFEPPHTDANNLGTQVSFVWDQLEGRTNIPEKTAGTQLKATTNILEAVLAFQGTMKLSPSDPIYGRYAGKYAGYERPADQAASIKERYDFAVAALAKYGSGGGGVAADGVMSCNDGTNVVVGDMSLPTDQRWYDKYPEWFTKPHHDYPSADIPIPTGTRIYAVAKGKVTRAPITTADASYGQGVEVDVGNGIIMIYGHGTDGGSIAGAQVGDVVSPGQLIMHSGNTGNSTGPHLHFEIRYKGVRVCPQSLLDAIGKRSPLLPAISELPRTGCSY